MWKKNLEESVAAVWQACVFIARWNRDPLVPCLASSLKRVASVLLGLAHLLLLSLALLESLGLALATFSTRRPG